MHVLHVNVGSARKLRVGERTVLSAIGKTPVQGDVAVQRLGLIGDEQADLNVHGGLQKAVYAYPLEHYPLWQRERVAHGTSLFDEPLPPGFLGENLTITGLLEHEVWVGDTLHFPRCVLRVTAPREPCYKFNAVMGFALASKVMVQHNACGFYLAVDESGFIAAGESFTLQSGSRALRIDQAFGAKRIKHLR